MQDTSKLKEKILSILRRRGPSLPVHIAGETGLSILFASAFLSELISERKVKISNLRIGSSPIYFIPGQEPQLEKFSQHLKSKEKDAYLLLKEKKFLEDAKQDPAIRVALRSIKDFAIGFQKEGKIFWRYFAIPESEFRNQEKIILEKQPQEIKEEKEIEAQENKSEEKDETLKTKIPKSLFDEVKKDLNIFDKKEQESPETKQEKIKGKIKPPREKTASKKKPPQKANEKFFDKVKEYLNQKGIEITGIEGFSKDDLTLKIKENGEEKILVAYNKKRLTDKDLLKAYKKASDTNLKYIILSLGEFPKKVTNMMEAIKTLSSIEKL